jgi:hypothetical protein
MKSVTLYKRVQDCHFEIAETPEELLHRLLQIKLASCITGEAIEYVPGMYVKSGGIVMVYATDEIYTWSSDWAIDSDGQRYTRLSQPTAAAAQLVSQRFAGDISTPFYGRSGSPGVSSATDLDCVVSLALGRWINVSSSQKEMASC